MEYSKVIDFLHTYPSWFRVAIVGWILLTALVASGFLLVKRESAAPEGRPSVVSKKELDPPLMLPDPKPELSASQAGSSVPSGTFITFDSYVEERKALDGRFVQVEQFDRSSVGKTVSWEGSLYSVNGLTDEASPALITVYSYDNDRDFFGAFVGTSDKLFLSSLRRGDRVRVTGTITHPGRSPNLNADKVELK